MAVTPARCPLHSIHHPIATRSASAIGRPAKSERVRGALHKALESVVASRAAGHTGKLRARKSLAATGRFLGLCAFRRTTTFRHDYRSFLDPTHDERNMPPRRGPRAHGRRFCESNESY